MTTYIVKFYDTWNGRRVPLDKFIEVADYEGDHKLSPRERTARVREIMANEFSVETDDIISIRKDS